MTFFISQDTIKFVGIEIYLPEANFEKALFALGYNKNHVINNQIFIV